MFSKDVLHTYDASDASGRDRKIYCKITNTAIIQSILPSIHTIKLQNCFLLKLKPHCIAHSTKTEWIYFYEQENNKF